APSGSAVGRPRPSLPATFRPSRRAGPSWTPWANSPSSRRGCAWARAPARWPPSLCGIWPGRSMPRATVLHSAAWKPTSRREGEDVHAGHRRGGLGQERIRREPAAGRPRPPLLSCDHGAHGGRRVPRPHRKTPPPAGRQGVRDHRAGGGPGRSGPARAGGRPAGGPGQPGRQRTVQPGGGRPCRRAGSCGGRGPASAGGVPRAGGGLQRDLCRRAGLRPGHRDLSAAAGGRPPGPGGPGGQRLRGGLRAAHLLQGSKTMNWEHWKARAGRLKAQAGQKIGHAAGRAGKIRLPGGLQTEAETLAVAFGMFSAVPAPQPAWNEKNMRYALCAFPLVGAAVALVFGAWGWAAAALDLPVLLRAAGFCLLPVWITGGIHLDGYADTCDALASYASQEERLAILKDPHCGAFAVIRLCSWFVADLALCAALPLTSRAVGCMQLGFVLE